MSENISARIRFYPNGTVEEIAGSENFVNDTFVKLKIVDDARGALKDEKQQGVLLSMANFLYNTFAKWRVAISWIIVIVSAALVILASMFAWVRPFIPTLNRAVLQTLVGGLITLLAVLVAIIAAFGKMDQGSKLALWKQYLVHYFKYIFVLITADLVVLTFSKNLLELMSKWYFLEAFSLPMLLLHVYAFFLIIKATEKYFNAKF